MTDGAPHRADSLRQASETDAAFRSHRGILLEARLAAVRGDWNGARTRLESWLASPARTGNTGEVYFWLAWVALHQGEYGQADTLLVLASADTGSAHALDALEYRFAALLENGPALAEYLRGLPESPLPLRLRRASLEKIPSGSRLHPHALWQLARIAHLEGRREDFMDILQQLAAVPTPQGRRAAAFVALAQEQATPDSAILRYENLLFQQQNGPHAEFSRARLRKLRQSER